MAHTSFNVRIAPLALLLVGVATLLFVLSPSPHVVGAAPHAHGALKKRFFSGVIWGPSKPPALDFVKKAVVFIRPDPASPLPINGTITFSQSEPTGPTTIIGTITGLEANASRGLHIHQYGVSFPSCTAAGTHFNPFNVSHGAPENDFAHRHVGDLGNVQSDAQGTVTINTTDNLISLNGRLSVVGRGLVLHAGTDDLGLVDNEGSRTTGNAGARSGCGVIGIAAPDAA